MREYKTWQEKERYQKVIVDNFLCYEDPDKQYKMAFKK